MSETSKPEAWQRRVHIGLHHDIHFLRYAQRRVFADVPVRLGMQIAFGRVRRKTAPTGFGIRALITQFIC